LQTLIPRDFHSRCQAAKISRQKFPWSSCCRRPLRSPCHHRVLPGASALSSIPPRSLGDVVPDSVDQADAIPKPMMPFISPQQCCPQACDAPELSSPWHPEPAMLLNPRRAWARNTIVLPKPARLHCIFFFVILSLQILILIYYIAYVLLHCFDVLRCHIS
jgi:hypothetical protein